MFLFLLLLLLLLSHDCGCGLEFFCFLKVLSGVGVSKVLVLFDDQSMGGLATEKLYMCKVGGGVY